MESATNKGEKKPYKTPQLIVYGDVRELTEQSSIQGKTQDGGTVYAPDYKTR